MRWILLHMIEETARHAGHADLIRENIDGLDRRLSESSKSVSSCATSAGAHGDTDARR